MDYLKCFYELICYVFTALKDNSQWICAIALVVFGGMQYNVVLKQKNLILLDKRLKLKNDFENYIDNKLKKCLEPELNVKVFEENYEKMTKIAGDAYILFSKDISEKIMNLAKSFEELRTSIDYNICKNKKHDLGIYKSHDGQFEKDFGKLHAQIGYQKNLTIADMQLIMRKDKV